MLRQCQHQPICFLFREKAHATFGFFQHADFGNPRDPAPVITSHIENVPNDFESAIDGSVCDTISQLSILDKRPQSVHVDISESISTQILIELLEVRLIVKKTTLVRVIFQVLNNRILPIAFHRYPGSGSLVGLSL
jgi:hypothetical protein